MRFGKEGILKPGDIVKDTYVVDRLIGAGAFGEVYRVTHKYLGLQALKLLRPGQATSDKIAALASEAGHLTTLTHPNVVRVFEANSFELSGRVLYFLVLEYVSGETLFQLLRRKVRISLPLALSIQRDICAGLSAAHQNSPPIIHRDLKPQNILLSYDGSSPVAKVADFGLAKAVDPMTRMTDSAGTIPYLPPEGFWGFHNEASDVFSAGIILYQMVTGMLPWSYEFANLASDDLAGLEESVLEARKKDPPNPSKVNQNCDTELDAIILRCLDKDPERRFCNAAELLTALLAYEDRDNKSKHISREAEPQFDSTRLREYKGFTGVAGMEEIKELLYSEIILPLQQKELYEKYRIPLPNGILFFGPPGCGKTFISSKLAEEIKHTFIQIRPSDLASPYVHGGQQKIGELFRDARERAPSIVVFDEIDSLIPIRGGQLGHHYESEVNEFLNQLNESSRDNVVVIGTTNRPSSIDPAALRTGRFDKLIYIPPPDQKARMSLFMLYLSGRPVADSIDHAKLARWTENYVASDIKAIVDDSARFALRGKSSISMDIIESVLKRFPPSITTKALKQYDEFRKMQRG